MINISYFWNWDREDNSENAINDKQSSTQWIKKMYGQVEKIRLELWKNLQNTQDDLINLGQLESSDLVLNSAAEYDGQKLKITIADYLPRTIVAKKDNAIPAIIRQHWYRSIMSALQDLDIKPYYEMALITIIVYVPFNCEWDVDNRIYKVIIDGLRYAKIINGDSWDRMSFMVIGRVDKEFPRTEILLQEAHKIFPYFGIEL